MPTLETLMNNKGVMIGLALIAFLVALWLVIVIVRLLLGGRLRMPGGRSRQARLGIVDAFDLDRQRQLIIVRRDNTEHLIMIGGPNDLLIESEIVRIEARDVSRGREKLPEGAPGLGERIPAPFAPVERPEPPPLVPDAGAPRKDEPRLPLPEAVPAAVSPAVEPPRGPTFPLPPRRPQPAGPAPERRPVPPPLRLPESVVREGAAPVPSQVPPPPNEVPPNQVPPAPDQVPLNQVPPPNAPVPPAPGAAPAARPSFLKPLPPRPPIRPLKRVTPQGPPPAPPPQDTVPAPPAAPIVPEAVVPPPAATEPPPPAPPPAAAKPVEDKADALDSLEEEMAKLLGRGPGG